MDWREEYRDQGFIVCEKLLPHDLIDAHLAQVAALSRRYGVVDSTSMAALPMETDDEFLTAMLDLHHRSDIAQQLIFNRIINSVLRQLFETEPALAFARSALWQPTSMRAHVDTAFRSPEPPYFVCRTWCALEDIHPESGLFYLAPGTHRNLVPRLCDEVLSERPDLLALSQQVTDAPGSWQRLYNRGWPLVNAKVAERIDESDRISFDLGKGDVIFFNPAVAHGASACSDPRVTRKMMVCEWTTKEAMRLESLTPPAGACLRARPLQRDNLIDITPILASRGVRRRQSGSA